MEVKFFYSNKGRIEWFSSNLDLEFNSDLSIVLDITEEIYIELKNMRHLGAIYPYEIKNEKLKQVHEKKYFVSYDSNGFILSFSNLPIQGEMILNTNAKPVKYDKVDILNQKLIKMSQAEQDNLDQTEKEFEQKQLKKGALNLSEKIYLLNQLEATIDPKIAPTLTATKAEYENNLITLLSKIEG